MKKSSGKKKSVAPKKAARTGKDTKTDRAVSVDSTRGRPPLWNDPALRLRLCKAIEEGNCIETAVQLSGIAASTYYAWKKDAALLIAGQTGSGVHSDRKEFLDFMESLTQAEARAEQKLLADIQTIATERNDWRAKAFILERRFPARWGRKDALDLTSHGEGVFVFDPAMAAMASRKASETSEQVSSPEFKAMLDKVNE